MSDVAPEIEFRALSRADRALIEPIIRETQTYYFSQDAGAAVVARRLCVSGGAVQTELALRDGSVVAYACYAVFPVGMDGRGTLYLKDLFVSAQARGLGVGRRMMARLAALAQAHGCSRLDWTAEDTNSRALDFYDEMGAARVSEKVYYRLTGETLDRVARDGGEG